MEMLTLVVPQIALFCWCSANAVALSVVDFLCDEQILTWDCVVVGWCFSKRMLHCCFVHTGSYQLFLPISYLNLDNFIWTVLDLQGANS